MWISNTKDEALFYYEREISGQVSAIKTQIHSLIDKVIELKSKEPVIEEY